MKKSYDVHELLSITHPFFHFLYISFQSLLSSTMDSDQSLSEVSEGQLNFIEVSTSLITFFFSYPSPPIARSIALVSLSLTHLRREANSSIIHYLISRKSTRRLQTDIPHSLHLRRSICLALQVKQSSHWRPLQRHLNHITWGRFSSIFGYNGYHPHQQSIHKPEQSRWRFLRN